MATQYCSTCKVTKTVDGQGWEEISVFMCAECCAADRPRPTGEDAALFDKLDELRMQIQSAKTGREFGTDRASRDRAQKDFDRYNDQLGDVLDAMTVEQLRGYRDHRRTVMAAMATEAPF